MPPVYFSHFGFSVLTIALLVIFPLPFFFCLLSWEKPPTKIEYWINRYTCAFGFGLISLWIISSHSLQFFPLFWGTTVILSAFLAIRARLHGNSNLSVKGYSDFAQNLPILAVIVVAFLVLRLTIASYLQFPPGWDPYFHMILIEKIQIAQSLIFDWEPYDTIPLNYPIGSHLVLALLGNLLKVPPHITFSGAQIFVSLLCLTQLYALFRSCMRTDAESIYAVVIFGFWASYGGLANFALGSMPNELGLCLLFSILAFLMEDTESSKNKYLLSLAFISISFIHIHVFLVSALTLGTFWIRLKIKAIATKQLSLLTESLVLATVLGSPYLLSSVVLRVFDTKFTASKNFWEPLQSPTLLFESGGPPFFLLLFCSGIYFYRNRKTIEPLPFPIVHTVFTLTITWFFLDYIGRYLVILFVGKNLSLLVASRFLTDAIPVLCIFPAIMLAQFGKKFQWNFALSTLVLILLGGLNLPIYKEMCNPSVSTSQLAAYEYIQKNLPLDTVVLDTYVHASYFTKRISSTMPLPASEFIYLAKNRDTFEKMKLGKAPEFFKNRKIVRIIYNLQTNLMHPQIWSSPLGVQIVELQQ